MRIKLFLSALLFVSTARATLIDLTPGGFDPNNAPLIFYQFINYETTGQISFFDEAAHGWFDLPEGRQYLDGWVSRYGVLNGGTNFFTDLFGHDTPTASVSWDFSTLPNWGVTDLLLFGRDQDGKAWYNLYAVPNGFRFIDAGDKSRFIKV